MIDLVKACKSIERRLNEGRDFHELRFVKHLVLHKTGTLGFILLDLAPAFEEDYSRQFIFTKGRDCLVLKFYPKAMLSPSYVGYDLSKYDKYNVNRFNVVNGDDYLYIDKV